MLLALDPVKCRQASRRSLTSRPDAEDWRLPLRTLGSKILVLGSLGRDTARQGDVGEQGVVFGHGDVELLVC